MKLIALCIAAACCVASPAIAADEDSRAELRRAEKLQDRKNEAPTGEARRQHFLYDAENQPETTGAGTGEDDCKDERVRVPRGDGTTAVSRLNKCR